MVAGAAEPTSVGTACDPPPPSGGPAARAVEERRLAREELEPAQQRPLLARDPRQHLVSPPTALTSTPCPDTGSAMDSKPHSSASRMKARTTSASVSSGVPPRAEADQHEEADPARPGTPRRTATVSASPASRPGPAAPRERPADVVAQLLAGGGEDLPARLVVGLEPGRHHAAERVGLRAQDVLVPDVQLDARRGALSGWQRDQRSRHPSTWECARPDGRFARGSAPSDAEGVALDRLLAGRGLGLDHEHVPAVAQRRGRHDDPQDRLAAVRLPRRDERRRVPSGAATRPRWAVNPSRGSSGASRTASAGHAGIEHGSVAAPRGARARRSRSDTTCAGGAVGTERRRPGRASRNRGRPGRRRRGTSTGDGRGPRARAASETHCRHHRETGRGAHPRARGAERGRGAALAAPPGPGARAGRRGARDARARPGTAARTAPARRARGRPPGTPR